MAKHYDIKDLCKYLNDSDVPIFIPVFNLVSYAKMMVNQLISRNIYNFVLCDNGSTYPEMVDYLEEMSKFHHVLYLPSNPGPRVFADNIEFLRDMPEIFIVTDPDLIFNENLPDTFISDMLTVLDSYSYAKVGMALEIFKENKSSKFFDKSWVHGNESKYFNEQVGKMQDDSPIFIAPIDTTFALHSKDRILSNYSHGKQDSYVLPSLRIGGNYSCEHMGWWENQPVPEEEFNFYKQSQIWSSTINSFN
jgi:hypothetical protein